MERPTQGGGKERETEIRQRENRQIVSVRKSERTREERSKTKNDRRRQMAREKRERNHTLPPPHTPSTPTLVCGLSGFVSCPSEKILGTAFPEAPHTLIQAPMRVSCSVK